MSSALIALLLSQAVDPEGLAGRVFSGYQGWFSAEGDGSRRGWAHWGKRRNQPLDLANVQVDLWPDLSELGPDERFATGLRHADGRVAEVFSSARPATVLRHWRWMREAGIDGVFVQRFIADLRSPVEAAHVDAVLAACREGAAREGRVFAVMYDLTGMKAARMDEVLADWKALKARGVADDPRAIRLRGKPLVAVWGVGFNDGRAYGLADAARALDALKADGCAVMLGVPTGWRTLDRDAAPDPALHAVLKRADVISPWTVGRYAKPEEAARHGERVVAPDLAWCRAAGLEYLPVAFPGFSWSHLHGGPLDQIPRLKGRFFWAQAAAAKRAGATALYVAMFDEVDEATAIFKCANEVPQGGFVALEGLSSDFYLRLAGAAGRLMRGEIPPSDEVPIR